MLSIHYVSIRMRIFYIDWQQHWECDRTMNIGDQQNSHKWQTSVDQLTVGLPVTSEKYWASFKSLDCFTKRLFHTATIFAATYIIVVWNYTRLITRLKSFFFFLPRFDLRRILISRPPRVFRRFKRRSCLFSCWISWSESWINCLWGALLFVYSITKTHTNNDIHNYQ